MTTKQRFKLNANVNWFSNTRTHTAKIITADWCGTIFWFIRLPLCIEPHRICGGTMLLSFDIEISVSTLCRLSLTLTHALALCQWKIKCTAHRHRHRTPIHLCDAWIHFAAVQDESILWNSFRISNFDWWESINKNTNKKCAELTTCKFFFQSKKCWNFFHCLKNDTKKNIPIKKSNFIWIYSPC